MWDLLTARDDLRRTEVRTRPDPEPAGGEALLEVERFALTSNNITYGRLGDDLGYWRFFHAPDGWGRLPAWGFARVVRSRSAAAPEGLRVYGYLPMSTHVVVQPAAGSGPATAFVDTAPHRAGLSPTLNAYTAMSEDPFDGHHAAFRPLFATAVLLDDALAEPHHPGTVIISSASSKTATALAWLLGRRGVRAVGLTSPDKVDALARRGHYQRLVSYDQVAGLDVDGPTALVDLTGNPAVVRSVHHRLAGTLTRSVIVGATHWEATGRDGAALPGPRPALFFTPEQVRVVAARPGGAALLRMDGALRAFVAANPWLRLVHHTGPAELQTIYGEVVDGRANPDDVHIVVP